MGRRVTLWGRKCTVYAEDQSSWCVYRAPTLLHCIHINLHTVSLCRNAQVYMHVLDKLSCWRASLFSDKKGHILIIHVFPVDRLLWCLMLTSCSLYTVLSFHILPTKIFSYCQCVKLLCSVKGWLCSSLQHYGAFYSLYCFGSHSLLSWTLFPATARCTWLQPADRDRVECRTFNPTYRGLIGLTVEFGQG